MGTRMGVHRSMSSHWPRRAAALLLAIVCVATVPVYGELSVQALVAVTVTGVVLSVIGLVRRSGEAADPVGRRARPWVAWLVAALVWELATLRAERLPTLSDLMDPVLAHPVPRGAAAIAWLAAGAWLLTRPVHADDAR